MGIPDGRKGNYEIHKIHESRLEPRMELGRNTDFSSVFERCLIRGSNTYGITRAGPSAGRRKR